MPERIPDAQLRLPDGTYLMLYRNEGWTDQKTEVRVLGDRMVALEPGRPRIVVFVYEQNDERGYSDDLRFAHMETWGRH
jgi:hypothetical protein